MKNCEFFKIIVFSLLFLGFLSSSCFCAPKKKKTKQNTEEKTAISTKNTEEIQEGLKSKTYTYFSYIDEQILADVEFGSPSSLRKAASNLRKSEIDYRESEKVLLAVESGIMQIAYPSERVDWETPVISEPTPYIAALNSAKNGIYDLSTGNVDFLTTIIPSLVVFKVKDVSYFFDDSLAALNLGLSMRSDSVLVYYMMGTLYEKNRMYDKALECFKKAYDGVGDCLEITLAYASSLYKNGDNALADSMLKTLVEKYPANSNVLRMLSEIAFNNKNYDDAEKYISRCLQQQPNDLEALLFRAKILMEKKDYLRAASLLDLYSRQDSSSKNYLILRATLQYDWSKNLVAAMATVENALKLYPNDADVQLFAAKLSNASGRFIAGKSSEEYANAVLQKDSENENALRYAIEGLMIKKSYLRAYELSSKLISKNKSDIQNIFNHIEICLKVGKKDEAWNLISPLYKSHQNDETVVQAYIIALDETNRDSHALALIAELLPSANSKMKSFLYYRRSLLQNDENDSLADLRLSLIANPRNSEALFELYKIYFGKKDYRKAQYYLKQVVALNPNDEEAHRLNNELTLLLN